MKEKIDLNSKTLAVVFVVAAIIVVILGFLLQTTGKDIGMSKVVEFTSTGLTTSGVYDSISSINSTAEIVVLEDLQYIAYFNPNTPDEQIISGFKDKLDIAVTEVQTSNSITARYYPAKYILALGGLLGLLTIFALVGRKAYNREFRFKVTLTFGLSTLYLITLMTGIAFLPSLVGLYRFDLWTVSLIEFTAIVVIVMRIIDISNLFMDEYKFKSVGDEDVFLEFISKRNEGYEYIIVGLLILVSSIYLVVATPFAYGAILIVLFAFPIYYTQHFVTYKIFKLINDNIKKINYIKLSKFWQSS
jgi:hypothetical protein